MEIESSSVEFCGDLSNPEPMTRAGATNEAKVVIDKLVELTEKL